MPVINNIIAVLADYLRMQQFTPQLREVTTTRSLPAAVFPRAVISVEDELFNPGTADVTAGVVLRISCTKGRQADARQVVRDLAHQVRRSLYASSNLQGEVKALVVHRITYDADPGPEGERLVVAQAEMELGLKYCEQEL